MNPQKRFLTNIFFTIIICSFLASAVNTPNVITPINPNLIQQPTITPQQMQDFYTIEETKTRNEFITYTNSKINEAINMFKIDGQRMIDENFAVFDQSMHEMLQQFTIKFVILNIATIILAQALWYFLKRKIENVGKKVAHLHPDEFAHMVAGIITEEYKAKAKLQSETNTQTPTYTDKDPTPRPPTVEEVEKIIHDRKFAKEIAQKKKEEEKIQKQKQKEIAKIEKEQKKAQKVGFFQKLAEKREAKELAKLEKEVETQRIKEQKMAEIRARLDSKLEKQKPKTEDLEAPTKPKESE